jgi:hypothetical protein
MGDVMRKVAGLLIVLLGFFFLPLRAQDQATIVGTVTDSTGAVIAGARITVSNPERGYVRELLSNGSGQYSLEAVPIGNCVISAEMPGFQKLVHTGLVLSVGQTLRVDLQLAVGKTTSEVTVTGNVPHVETETGTISSVVTGSQVLNLELNGRNFVQLATLVPGAVPDNGLDTQDVGVLGNNNISFNGGRMTYTNWEIDGGGNTDDTSSGAFNTYPSLETIAEFRISTSNYSADMGKHAGAQIEVATRSGTKNFHGEMFDFLRNDDLDANDWFANRTINPPGGNAPKTPLKRNEFGYNLGGPFYIPGHYNPDKSKTFFFWSESWRRNRQGTVISNGTPSLRMRQGDFSECDPASANFNSIVASNCALPINPQTGETFGGDIVPIAPNGAALLNGLIPLPNNGVDTYTAAPSLPTNWRQEQIRVDQNIGNRTTAFVRFTNDAWETVASPSLWTSSVYDTLQSHMVTPGKSAVLHLTRNFSPSVMNEFIVSFNASHIYITPTTGASSPAGSIDKPSSWIPDNLFAANESNPLLPAFSFCGGTPICATEDASYYPWHFWGRIGQLKDNVAYVVGKQTLKFGFFAQEQWKSAIHGFDTQGFMTFTGSGPITTGNALADLYLGRIEQYQEGTNTDNGVPVGGYTLDHRHQGDLELYFQDDWKATPRLTLNLGVRYYIFQPYVDVTRPTVDAQFEPSLYNPNLEATLNASGYLAPNQATGHIYDYTMYGNGLVACGVGTIRAGCFIPSRDTPAPRFGFAYDLTGAGKTVIRGGYGLFYEMGNGNETNTNGTPANPPVFLKPYAYNNVGYQSITPGPIGPTSLGIIPYNGVKWPMEQQYNMGIEHEFAGNNLLGVSYVGSLGRHLARSRNFNEIPDGVGVENVPALAGQTGCDVQGNCSVQQILIQNLQPNIFFLPYQGYSTITMSENTAVSNYNSLQVSFRHTFGHGLTFQSAYTWSHSIDDATSYAYESGVDDSDLSRWRATSDTNRTQVLVMNYIYDLPFFKSTSSPLVKGALGGWKLSGITSFFTGEPADFFCGETGFLSGIGEGVRCNSLGSLKIQKGVFNDPQFGPTPTWFNPNVIGQVTMDQLYANNQPGMFGTMGRNPLTGPGRNNWDMALLKNFGAPWFNGEHSTVQFRWETFNTFNHPQWQYVQAGCGGGTPFGAPCSGITNNLGNGYVSSAWPARIMQFGLKFIF